MVKRFQNKVAESRLALPLTGVYALLVWIAMGLLGGEMWVQFACFVVSAYLMVELNNSNALIRIYSRMVSCSFLALSCMACFTFSSEAEAIVGLCFIASYTTLLRSYQDRGAAGWIFYTFVCLGLGSIVNIHLLYYVPIVWILMMSYLRSMSVRTFVASLLGLLVPYWFASVYFIYIGDFSVPEKRLVELVTFENPLDMSTMAIQPNQIFVLAFVVILAIVGIIHYVRTSYNDKIRIRMYYDSFILVDVLTMVFLLLQPQHFDMLLRILIVNTSMLIAHFIALTHTKITNIAFCVIFAVIILLTAYNLWMPSLICW